jgi:hypothetical protein
MAAIAEGGDCLGGVVRLKFPICHLRGRVIVRRVAVGEDDMFRIAAGVERVVADRPPSRDDVVRGTGVECDGESGSPGDQEKKRHHAEEQNVNAVERKGL